SNKLRTLTERSWFMVRATLDLREENVSRFTLQCLLDPSVKLNKKKKKALADVLCTSM
ncbi:5474_t:CDS:2, partial [Cetraspora pellucida]